MAWVTVAESDRIETLGDDLTTDIELPKGTKVRFVMDLRLPVGSAFSLPGAEYIFRPFMPDGIDLIDVYGSGSQATIECEADPAFLLAALAFIKAHWLAIGLITIGITLGLAALIYTIRCDVDKPIFGDWATIVKWGAIGVLGIFGIKLLTEILGGRHG